MEQRQQHYKFSIRKKLVILTTALAVITYSTSAFLFLYFIQFFSKIILMK